MHATCTDGKHTRFPGSLQDGGAIQLEESKTGKRLSHEVRQNEMKHTGMCNCLLGKQHRQHPVPQPAALQQSRARTAYLLEDEEA